MAVGYPHLIPHDPRYWYGANPGTPARQVRHSCGAFLALPVSVCEHAKHLHGTDPDRDAVSETTPFISAVLHARHPNSFW